MDTCRCHKTYVVSSHVLNCIYPVTNKHLHKSHSQTQYCYTVLPLQSSHTNIHIILHTILPSIHWPHLYLPPCPCFHPFIIAAVFQICTCHLQGPLLSSTMLFTQKCRILFLFFVYHCYPLTHLSLFLSSTVHLPSPSSCLLSAAVLVCLPAQILPCFSSMLDFGL